MTKERGEKEQIAHVLEKAERTKEIAVRGASSTDDEVIASVAKSNRRTKMTEKRIKEEEMKRKLEEIEKTEEIVVGGETSIDDEVIAAIAGVAAREVEGVASLGTSSIRRILAERLGGAQQRARGVDVEAGKKEAIVDLTLNIIYGFSIPQIVIDVRKTVAVRLLEIAGLIAKEINVSVVGIEFPERMPGKLA
jgi:uncharacterized alkaline shock family protein YloU